MICGLLSTYEEVGGWRLHWLTRPAPRDPESCEGSYAMTGACLTVSQVQSIPRAAAPSSASLLLVTSVFVTPIVTRGNAAKPCTSWAAAAVGAPVSLGGQRDGQQVGARNGQADKIAAEQPRGGMSCRSGHSGRSGIHHIAVTVRAAGR
jgi:hypothetical protein